MAQRTCAALSFSEKYQWPEAGAAKFESSHSSHSSGSPDSSNSRTSLLRRETLYTSRSVRVGAGVRGESGGKRGKFTAGF
jgi:hypothetical protein